MPRLYCDQLSLTERHLDGLIDDADATLALLTSLSDSFQSVDAQTTTFQAQCEGLLKEKQRLKTLADEVETDLYYYLYLDTATRRLNAPGASRLVDDEEFGTLIGNIDSCIDFMNRHVSLPVNGSIFAYLVCGPIRRLTHSRRKHIGNATRTWRDTVRYSPRPCICWIMDFPLAWKSLPQRLLVKLRRRHPTLLAMLWHTVVLQR